MKDNSGVTPLALRHVSRHVDAAREQHYERQEEERREQQGQENETARVLQEERLKQQRQEEGLQRVNMDQEEMRSPRRVLKRIGEHGAARQEELAQGEMAAYRLAEQAEHLYRLREDEVGPRGSGSIETSIAGLGASIAALDHARGEVVRHLNAADKDTARIVQEAVAERGQAATAAKVTAEQFLAELQPTTEKLYVFRAKLEAVTKEVLALQDRLPPPPEMTVDAAPELSIWALLQFLRIAMDGAGQEDGLMEAWRGYAAAREREVTMELKTYPAESDLLVSPEALASCHVAVEARVALGLALLPALEEAAAARTERRQVVLKLAHSITKLCVHTASAKQDLIKE